MRSISIGVGLAIDALFLAELSTLSFVLSKTSEVAFVSVHCKV
jgi:hypothetical protein